MSFINTAVLHNINESDLFIAYFSDSLIARMFAVGNDGLAKQYLRNL